MMQHSYLELPEALFETSAFDTFSGELPLPPITMGADLYTFNGPVRYSLIINNTGGALLVTGSVAGSARTACARCLDEVMLDLESDVESYFVIPGKDAPLTEDEEVEYDLLVDSRKIDLTELCTATFALAFPYIPLCKQDCAGLCPQCGMNLNHGECDCEADDPSSSNPFAVLKDYKFDTGDNA